MKNFLLVFLASCALLATCSALQANAYAASGVSKGLSEACQSDIHNPLCTEKAETYNPLTKYIGWITTLVATIGGIVSVIFVIYGGYRYILSAGNPEKTSSALKTIIYALVGILVIVAAQSLILFILNQIT